MGKSSSSETLTWGSYGGTTYHSSTVGRWGCDHCWSCQRHPNEGETVWQNCYGDLYCDQCARRNASAA